MTLRILFMGSPQFAVPSLQAAVEAGDVVGVVTQPDKPAGRGRKLRAPAVKECAANAGLTVLQPKSVRTDEFLRQINALAVDVAVVVAYGKILPQAVLDAPKHGCLNVHASLLPKYRGAAPIQWAIANGETTTGVTIMQLDAGMDTGPTICADQLTIGNYETAGELTERLSTLGARLMGTTLRAIEAGTATPTAQDHDQATHARLLKKEDGRIDWTQSAVQVSCLIRGMDPWPSATTKFADAQLKVWGARVTKDSGQPGQVLAMDADGLLVACGQGSVQLTDLQLPGKKRMPAQALASGRSITPGTQLG